jgi:predicted enzyme related to lactoylglutathione lyase
MNRLVHFEIHASDPERTAAFYRQVFDWQIREWTVPGVHVPEENRYWSVTTGAESAPGINGGIVVRRGDPPSDGQAVNAFVCTVNVASVDRSVQDVLQAGGSLAVPKMPIKGVGWLAYCRDPAGNLFGVMTDDPGAE